MVPIFIKLHTANGLMRVNVGKIRSYAKRASRFDTDTKYNTTLFVNDYAMWVRETPAQIDNLIEKATLSRFKKIDEVV